MKKFEYWLNDIYYEKFVDEDLNLSLFQVCSSHGIHLPCFCYHENLSIAGNCRMCLVEINTSLKLVVSCAMPLVDGVKIYTNSIRVIKAREAVIEFLLINHPLDCPICDQGGECDLQDITLAFGSDRSRYYEYEKRAVSDKDCGQVVKMVMTRCIHRTRCIRFLNEVAGSTDLGMLGRGNSSEISTYIFRALNNELFANIIDLCPVGALTSKPYAFKARPWELNNLESIDVMDSMCSNVRIDYLSNKVVRILPVYSKSLNEDWITNKARFVYESLDVQRIEYPKVKVYSTELQTDIYVSINWYIATKIFLFNLIKVLFNNNKAAVLAVSGFFTDLTATIDVANFFNKLGAYTYVNDFFNLSSDFRNEFLLNTTLINLELKTCFVFVGFNPRLEAPLVNTKLRKAYYRNKHLRFFSYGLVNSYTNLPIVNVANSVLEVVNILKGKASINKYLFNPRQIFTSNIFIGDNEFTSLALVFGISAVKLVNIQPFFRHFVKKHFLQSSSCGTIYPYSGFNNFFEINNNFCTNKINLSSNNFVYLHKVDERFFLNCLNSTQSNYIVYHGSHFDVAAKYSKLFLPVLTHFEDNYYYINFEGKLKLAKKSISNSKEILTTNELFRLLNIVNKNIIRLDFPLSMINVDILQHFDFLKVDFHLLNIYNDRKISLKNDIDIFNKYKVMNIEDNIFSSFIYNYYKMDSLSRCSVTLTLSSTEYLRNLNSF